MRETNYFSALTGVFAAALLCSASGAFAAELPVKAPPVPVARIPSWTGFYLGGNVGGGWSEQTFINNFAPFGDLGGVDAAPSPSGWVGGIQGGYNLQINSALLGIEGGFTWSGATSSFSCFPLLAPQTCTADPKWLADLAARAGAIVGPALFYVKGGAAWVHDNYSNLALPGAPAIALPGVLFTADETRAGWVVGGGIEYMFLPNWSARLEYDYYGFPDESVRFSGSGGNFFTEEIKQSVQTVTVGINYHFGGAAATGMAPLFTK
jgi:outer membrane immunogenic protein